MKLYKKVDKNDFLLCSKGVFSFSSDPSSGALAQVAPSRSRARRIWVSPESTDVYFIAQEVFNESADIESICAQWGFSQETHRISFHRVNDWLCAVVVCKEEWARVQALARQLVPYLGASQLYFIDLWLMQQALSNVDQDISLILPGAKYSYRLVNECPARLFEEGYDENQKLEVNSVSAPLLKACHASDIFRLRPMPAPFAWHLFVKYTLTFSLVCLAGLLLMLSITRQQLASFKGPYLMQLQGYVKKHDGILGHLNEGEQWALSTYFDRMIDPLGEIIHPNSFINQMIFNPLTNSVLLLGVITDSKDVTQWMKLKKHESYKNLQVSMLAIPSNQALIELDRPFSYNTDVSYDNASLLVLQQPYMLPNFRTKTIMKALAFLSDDGENA